MPVTHLTLILLCYTIQAAIVQYQCFMPDKRHDQIETRNIFENEQVVACLADVFYLRSVELFSKQS